MAQSLLYINVVQKWKAVEVDMSSRMTLRKAVLELLKQSESNVALEPQISEHAEKQPDRNIRESNESKLKWIYYLNSYSL